MTPFRSRLFLALILSTISLVFSTQAAARDGETTQSGSATKASKSSKPPKADQFEALFDIGIVPSEKSAHVAIKLGSGSKAVEWIRLSLDPLRHRALEADGTLEEVEGGVRWTPPAKGGSLRYVLSIDHLRDDNSFDARCAKNWALLRGEDLVPRMRIRTTPGAKSVSTLKLRLPEGWSAALPYPSDGRGQYSLDDDRTRFDRPSGWLAFGKLGVVREKIQGTHFSIAGPAGQGARRLDTLAMLQWTYPSLLEVFGDLPDRFQVVIAGDPMWRGGLSGPRSIYLHVDRPLISGDGSSPLLHEIVHSLMHARSGKGGRWIVEGLAEYYSIALLRRSDTLAADRFERSIDGIRKRAAPGTAPLDGEMNSALRAKAVLVLIEVDRLIRDSTAGSRNLDDLVRAMVDSGRAVTVDHFRLILNEVSGKDFPDFFDRIQTAQP